MRAACALLAVLVAALLAGGLGQPASSPLRIAQCRATCLQQFSSSSRGQSSCMQDPDCFMCWENCELLQSNASMMEAICNKKATCFPGCQAACRFHRGEPRPAQPVVHTSSRQVVRVARGSASWPQPVRQAAPLVYVLMWRPAAGAAWAQVAQTADLQARLPVGGAGWSVRVLAVGPAGLITVYSPPRTRTVVTPAPLPPPAPRQDSTEWTFREVSLIHQKVLVIAELSWRPPRRALEELERRGGAGVYLVTWEVDGGGLRGNLFTDSTCVTLSLWPDTVYHIQVELMSHGESVRSRSLQLDTHRAAATPPPFFTEAVTRRQGMLRDVTVMLASLAVVASVVTAVVVAACHRQHRRPRPQDVCKLLQSPHADADDGGVPSPWSLTVAKLGTSSRI